MIPSDAISNEAGLKLVPVKTGRYGKRSRRGLSGPRTVEGKQMSRMNAVKHGILSGQVVVRGLRIQEQEEEFKALRARYWESYAPVGPGEEMLVEKIVTCQWRLRRVLQAETGEIALSVDGRRWKRENDDVIERLLSFGQFSDLSDEMEKSSEGLGYLRRVLERVRDEVSSSGELTGTMCEWVRGRFGGQSNLLTKVLEGYRGRYLENLEKAKGRGPSATEEGMEEENGRDARSTEELREGGRDAHPTISGSVVEFSVEELKGNHRRAVLQFVEMRLEDYARLNRERWEREDKQETARQAADMLPTAEVLEKIMRYEGALNRELYRAMNQLERLQRRRRGENVPPPLTMEVVRR